MAGGAMGALAVASALMIGVYNLGSISGAHLNPAVTLGITLWDSKKNTPALLGMYWGVQFFAGALAAVCAGATFNTELGGPSSWSQSVNTTNAAMVEFNNMNALGPADGYDQMSVIFAEMMYTFVLVFVVINVACCGDVAEPDRNQYFGLSIGFVIIAGAMSIGSITQCSLNPAVSLGAATGAQLFGGSKIDAGQNWVNFLIYCLGEFLGAGLAVALAKLVRANDGKPSQSKLAPCVAEFLGTFVLVLTVNLVVMGSGGAPLGVLGIACSLMVMIYALAKVSGGQFNPAVSTGLVLIQELELSKYGMYVVSQLLGGFFAVLMAWLIRRQKGAGGYNLSFVDKNVADRPNVASGTWGSVAGSEIVYTFLLVFTVLNVAVADGGNQYYGLAIGFVIVAGGCAVGALSGGMFNPAVAISIDLGDLMNPNTKGTFGYSFVYAAFELLGAALAAVVYRFLRKPSDEDHEDLHSGEESEE